MKNDMRNLERYLEGLLKDPNNPHLFNEIGVFLYQCMDWENSEKYFQRAYTLNPQDSDILYNYATLLYQRNKIETSINIFLRYLENYAQDKAVIQRVGDGYFQLGNYEQASKMYEGH